MSTLKVDTIQDTGGSAYGFIKQVVQATKTDTASRASASYADITGYSASITPSSTSSKILIIAYMNLSGVDTIHLKLRRGSTDILLGDAATGKTQVTHHFYGGDLSSGEGYFGMHANTITYLDSPSTTSSTTYSFQWKSSSTNNTIYINRTGYDGSSSQYDGRAASTIQLLEVAA